MVDRSELESMRRVLPLPIAQAMGRALESIHPAEQMKEWRMTMDVLISYINAIATAEYCSTTPVAKIDERLHQDPQQTDSGRGNIQLGSIFKRIDGKDTLFSTPFRKWYYSEIELNHETLPVCEHLKRLVTLRNQDTHARLSQEKIDGFVQDCALILKRCAALRHYHLFVVRQQSPTPVGSTGQISMLMGETPSSAFTVQWQGMTLLTGGIYLMNSSQDELLHMNPFLHWMEDGEIRRKTVFIWRLIKKGQLVYQSSLSNREMTRGVSVFGIQGEVEVSWREWLAQRPHSQRIVLDSGHLNWSVPASDGTLEMIEESDSEELSEEVSEMSYTGLKVLLGLGVVGGWLAFQWNQVPTHAVFPTVQSSTEEDSPTSIDDTDSSVQFALQPFRDGATLWLNGEQIPIAESVQVTNWPVEIEIRMDGMVCHQETLMDMSQQMIEVQWQCIGRSAVQMADIPAGVYQFGAEGDAHRHAVEISRSFSMMTTEVTQGVWHRMMGGAEPECFDCPKTMVSWNDAVDFANRLSEFEGLEPCVVEGDFIGLQCEGYRLPTEAEWEYAAKAGTEQLFAGANSPVSVAVFEWNSEGAVERVGQKKPNQWGLYDMSGNVFEWCLDDFVEEPVRRMDPLYQIDSPLKVGRGGGFRSKEEAIRSTSRSSASMDIRQDFIGFRLVRTTVP